MNQPKELELKHLAVYNELQVACYGLNDKENIETVIGYVGNCVVIANKVYTPDAWNWCFLVDLKNVKPLLQSLADYAEKEAEHYGYISMEFEARVKSGHIESRIMDDLYRDKVDVFGLLEAGVALSIHDVKEK